MLKFSSIDNYSVHNTVNSKSHQSNKNISAQPEKINVNLSNISKPNNNTKESKNRQTNEENNEFLENNEIQNENPEEIHEMNHEETNKDEIRLKSLKNSRPTEPNKETEKIDNA